MVHSLRMAQDVYRSSDAADLQRVLRSPDASVQQGHEGDLIQVLVNQLGLSIDEVIRRLLVR